MGKFSTGLKIAVAVPPLIAAKYFIIHSYLKRRAARLKMEQSNRRQFGALSRIQQRSVLYARRQQLADLQTIYRKGYAPRMPGQSRRRRFF